MGKRDISVEVNYPKGKDDLKELENRKAKIVIDILEETYGDVILNQYVSNMRRKK